jgi:TetR/AcrR family transcriptional regulator, cholesterol catabolism regulator
MPQRAPEGTTEAPLRTRRGERRQRVILRSAAELFDGRGYHQTHMVDIAAAAGIGKATLYHYFRSKDEILYWLHDEFIELLIERQEIRAQSDMSPSEQLLAVIADILELMDTHRGYVRVFFEHWRELPSTARQLMAARRKHYERLVEQVIADGYADGAFREVDVELSALSLFGMCNWTYQWYKPDGPLRGRDIAAVFHDLFLNGIGQRRLDPSPRNRDEFS